MLTTTARLQASRATPDRPGSLLAATPVEDRTTARSAARWLLKRHDADRSAGRRQHRALRPRRSGISTARTSPGPRALLRRCAGNGPVASGQVAAAASKRWRARATTSLGRYSSTCCCPAWAAASSAPRRHKRAAHSWQPAGPGRSWGSGGAQRRHQSNAIITTSSAPAALHRRDALLTAPRPAPARPPAPT